MLGVSFYGFSGLRSSSLLLFNASGSVVGVSDKAPLTRLGFFLPENLGLEKISRMSRVFGVGMTRARKHTVWRVGFKGSERSGAQ